MRTGLFAALLLAAVVVVAASETELAALDAGRPPGHHLLYLPNGRYLRLASLGHEQVLADLLYLWSIQYYGNYQIEDRYRYVEHIYGNVITELDPHYVDPYWLGALILSIEMKEPTRALRLLDKGIRNNPDEWIFPYLAGWECANFKAYDRAAAYFRAAAAAPGAPAHIPRLVAGMYQRGGDPATALAEWVRIGRETSDPAVRRIAESRVRALETEVALATVRTAIQRYRESRGTWPRRLEDLVVEGFLSRLRGDPESSGFSYDRNTGEVAAGPARVLPESGG